MSTRAVQARHPARRTAPKRAAPAARPRPRPRIIAPRPRTRLRILLIPLIAVLLAGIVWVNVAKLSLTTQTTEVVERARAVAAENSRLEGQRAAQEGQIQNLARKMGMTEVPSDAATFLQGAGATR